MKEKLKKYGQKLKKLLLRLLVLALICGLTYFVYTHRRVIRALLKGEPLPKGGKGHGCCCRKRK